MKQILKRLEIIKSSISIDDEEIIELQIMKLEKLSIDFEVQDILNKLENLDYGNVVTDIENYITKYSGLVEYIDTELQGLKLELKSLENKIQNLSEIKNEYLNDIEEFNTLYSINIGDIINKILKLKEQILQDSINKQHSKYEEDVKVFQDTKETIEEIKNTIDELEKVLENIDKDDEKYDEIYTTYQELQDEHKKLEEDLSAQEEQLSKVKEELEDELLSEEYQEAKTNYEEFNDEYENIKETFSDICNITDDEKKELKKLWKKACKLCHPDIVSDKLKEQSHEIMQALNEAYSKKDLVQVKEILLNLEKGIGFELASDSVEDKEILKVKIKEYRVTISDIENDIENIKQDETYKTIQNIDNIDIYFENLREELELNFTNLKLNSLENEKLKVNSSFDKVTEDTNIYLSTTTIARKNHIEAKPYLFDELITLNLLYKEGKSYKLTDEGLSVGGKYEENTKGEKWVVWKENSLNTIIENLKRKLGVVENTIQMENLTRHQDKVFEEIIKNINNIFDNKQIDKRISLSGSAGVGKTFLTVEIIKYFKNLNIGLTITTPTHKALSVITDNLNKYNIKDIEARTLHSFLQLKSEIDERTGEKIFVTDEKNNDKNETAILIVDESSMIGNDLFQFITQAIQEERILAVLFVGDPYQLPPVNSEKNTIFELSNSYKLEEIIRQAKGSYIINIATKIRDCIINQDFSLRIEDFFLGNYNEFKIFSNEEAFLTDFFSNDSQVWYKKNQIIADYTNKSVDRYNDISRSKCWLDKGTLNPPQITKNDIVVFQEAVLNGEKVIFQNGSTTQIKECTEYYDNALELHYWLCEDYNEKKFKMIDDKSKEKYNIMLRNKISEAQNATSGFEKMNKWKSYYGLKEEYASVKFNYSSTIHKLQGSTYNTVFIDIRRMKYLYDNGDITNREFLYRLLYVAVTRASKNIRILK